MSDEITIRERAVRALAGAVTRYSDWACESGLYLPEEFATSPSDWAEILRKIQRGFAIAAEEMRGEGELWDAKHAWEKYGEKDVEKIKELERDIQEGFALFGKYLFHLTDKIVDRGPSH